MKPYPTNESMKFQEVIHASPADEQNRSMLQRRTLSSSFANIVVHCSLSKRSFSGFMSDICKSSKCIKTFTPHRGHYSHEWCMMPASFKSRQIMFMSGHRSEACLKTYNSNLSSQQKRSVSSCLSSITNPDRHLPSSAMSVLSGYSSESSVLSVNYLPTPDDCRPFLHVPHLSRLLTP